MGIMHSDTAAILISFRHINFLFIRWNGILYIYITDSFWAAMLRGQVGNGNINAYINCIFSSCGQVQIYWANGPNISFKPAVWYR